MQDVFLISVIVLMLGSKHHNDQDELTQKPPNTLNLQKNRLGFCDQLNPFVRK